MNEPRRFWWDGRYWNPPAWLPNEDRFHFIALLHTGHTLDAWVMCLDGVYRTTVDWHTLHGWRTPG